MRWLQREKPDPTRLLFAVATFGDLFYWRRLLDPKKNDVSWDEAGDISFLSVNHGIRPRWSAIRLGHSLTVA